MKITNFTYLCDGFTAQYNVYSRFAANAFPFTWRGFFMPNTMYAEPPKSAGYINRHVFRYRIMNLTHSNLCLIRWLIGKTITFLYIGSFPVLTNIHYSRIKKQQFSLNTYEVETSVSNDLASINLRPESGNSEIRYCYTTMGWLGKV